MERKQKKLQRSYDLVAADYANEFREEMSKKPFDRKMVEWLAERAGNAGVICDVGCGPGQIAGYLHRHGVRTCGIDISPEMVKQAQLLNPDIPFQQGNMLFLTGFPDNSYSGIAAFYSIVHIPHQQAVDVLRELKRVLQPGGVLLITFHIGKQIIHRDEWWDKKVSLDFIFYETEEMKGYLKKAGFDLQEVIERDPYPDVEYQSRRAYIFAKKPSAQRTL